MQVSFGKAFLVSASNNGALFKRCIENPSNDPDGKDPTVIIPVDSGDYLVLTDRTAEEYKKEKHEIQAAAQKQCDATVKELMRVYIDNVCKVAKPTVF